MEARFQDFETVLTAFTYLSIFEITAPLSCYLQTSGLNMFTAYNMVEAALEELRIRALKFEDVHSRALLFCRQVNGRINTLI